MLIERFPVVGEALDEARRHRISAVRHRRDHLRNLDRGCSQLPLPERHVRNCRIVAQLGIVRQGAALGFDLVGELRRAGKPDLPRQRDDPFAARRQSQMDKIGVAGNLDRFIEIKLPMTVAPMAVEDMPVHIRIALTGIGDILPISRLERGGSGYQLEGRANVILTECPVDKRAVRVLKAGREVICIVGRHRGRRLDVPIGNIHHHCGPLFDPLHRVLHRPLNVCINGQRHPARVHIVILEDFGRDCQHGLPGRVDGIAHPKAAVILVQQIIVGKLDACCTVGLFRVEIADDMRRQLVFRIALHRVKHFDPFGIDLGLLELHQIGPGQLLT